MRIDSILFDLDGTLIDSLPGIEYSARVAISEVLPHQQMSDLRRLIGPPIRDVLRDAVMGGVGADTLDELERRFRLSYDGQGWKKAVPCSGVKETLAWLSEAHVKCFVVTNKPILPAESILKFFGLFEYFAEVASLNSREPHFPSKIEASAYLIEKYKLDGRSTLLVGDSTEDAKAAHCCGIKFAAVTYGYGRPQADSTFPAYAVLHNLNELIPILGYK